MTKLVSEGLPSDGSFQLAKVTQQANDRLNKLGKYGKRAKLKITGDSVVLQFSFEGKQQQKGINCSFTKGGIIEAEKIAGLVTSQLSASSFTWEWFNNLIGKNNTSQEKSKHTCQQLIAEYKTHWLKENKNLKNNVAAWYRRFRHIEKTMMSFNEELSTSMIKKTIELTENNTFARTYNLQGLRNFLDYFDISDYDKLIQSYKAKNKPVPKKRNVPTDEKIKTVFKTGFKPRPSAARKLYCRYPQWQFLYGLLATYGLRVHEAWNIANWDKPVVLRQGDWLVVEENLSEESDRYEEYRGDEFAVPAILDPTNTDKILCIKHATKTGYRMAMPISPQGENWLDEFNLIQPLNLPDIKNPLDTTKCSTAIAGSKATSRWFSRNKYGFTPHDLRHAYNHRGHYLGYNPTLLSKSLGHSLQMNSTTYLRTMPDSRNLEMMREAITSEKEKQTEVERLKAENEFLKQQIESLKTENHLYKSLLEQIKSHS